MAIALFSKEYFKQHFFGDLVSLSSDVVANVRLKLCTMMPRLKSLLSLPSDKSLLQRLEATVKDLLLRETDADVLFALQTSIQDLDGTDTGKIFGHKINSKIKAVLRKCTAFYINY